MQNFSQHFPILANKIDSKKLIYFDSACSYLKNEKTISWIDRYYNEYSCCSWDREASYLWSKLFEEIVNSRNKIKDFIGAKKSDHIIFTSGTTDSINKLIYALDENKIKTLITSDLDHNSNFLPQLEYSKNKNIDFCIFPYKEILNLDMLKKRLSSIKFPFLFCFTHSSNIIWWNFEIKKIAEIVHNYWWYIFIDDAQYISYNQEKVLENDIDFLAFSAHKIWWPTGIGVFYIKNSSEDIIRYSNKVWWGTVKTIFEYIPRYKNFPDFLEWWVQHFAWILWFSDCLDFINNIWIDNINKYILELSDYFFKNFEKNNFGKEFDIISLRQSWIITLKPKNFNCIDFNNYCNYFLENYIISFRTWSVCADNYVNNYLSWDKNIIRISFGIYNQKKDIDIFIDVLKNYLKDI